jgi:U3 small nucleolar RNA-associated protein 14
MRDRDDHSKKETEAKVVSGWGSWTGEGAPAPRPPKKLPKRMAAPEKKIKRRKRQDDGKKNVIINAKRVKKNAKYQLENIPYPFKSRDQYERAMGGAIGNEWNVTTAVKSLTRSEVVTRAGKMIKPINKKAKMKRAPAKF